MKSTRTPMPAFAREALARVNLGNPDRQFWTPERVRNHAQAAFIKLQADRFGEMSPAGRFFSLCIERGCVSRDGAYLGPAQPVREPGQDDEEVAA